MKPGGRSLIAEVLARQGVVVLACLIALSALAWWWLWQHAMPASAMPMDGMGMSGMDMVASSPWSAGYIAAAFAMWAIMMVAMMLPSAAPMILLHDLFSRRNGMAAGATLSFALAYLAVWAGFALLAALLQTALLASGWIDAAGLALGQGRMAALLLFAAAAYELSPIKRACLVQCQSPAAFLTRHWRRGSLGALGMGLRHGAYCLGCCAVLMLLLFVGGVMNLAWIAGLSAVVLAEKYAPPAWRADRVLAGLLVAAAVFLFRT